MAKCCMAEPWSAVPEWIVKAEGDWEALEILLTRNTPGLRDAVVFHAQQCVEKLRKARLIQLGQAVDKIHDLATLSHRLEAGGSLISSGAYSLPGFRDLSRRTSRTGGIGQQFEASPEDSSL